jgi:hypothetical protein
LPAIEALEAVEHPELPYHVLDLCARLHLLDEELRPDIARAARCAAAMDEPGAGATGGAVPPG